PKFCPDPEAFSRLQKQVHLNAIYFRRSFKQITGLAPTDYLLRLRMREARLLLNQNSETVKEVAEAVGFRDPLYFSKQYRKFWGHPPGEDRSL
ncbi:MAG: helix-turn-helix transcriptional regulator, partial [Verrucomicrobiota bacterium]